MNQVKTHAPAGDLGRAKFLEKGYVSHSFAYEWD